MLEQELVSLGATNLRESKKDSDKAVISPQASNERTFYFHMLVKSFCIVFQNYILRQGFRFSFVHNLLLIFPQISGSCSYKIVRISSCMVA